MSKSKSNMTNLENKCNLCDNEIEVDNGDIVGEFGMSSVAFCIMCLSPMTDMIIQIMDFNNIETLKERISDLKDEK